MPTGSNASGIFDVEVVGNLKLCREHFKVTMRLDFFPTATAGQFVQVLCRSGTPGSQSPRHSDAANRLPSSSATTRRGTDEGPLLRRPFSLAGLRRSSSRCEIDIIARAVGAGTEWLSSRVPGDHLSILGPLGQGFSLPRTGEESLLVAGGVGLPPLLWWGQLLRARKLGCVAICGAQKRDLLPLTLDSDAVNRCELGLCAKEFNSIGVRTLITTDDGSAGIRGRVTDGLLRHFTHSDANPRPHVYACGPEPMLKAVSQFCVERNLSCQVALERMMGCGMGTCQSCVVPIKDETRQDGRRFALCCSEGPVFNAEALVW